MLGGDNLENNSQSTTKSVYYKFGIGLIIGSLFIWIIPIIVPFTPISLKLKGTIITIAVIIAEILFWVGAVLAGRTVAAKIRSYLNPRNWYKKKVTTTYEEQISDREN